MNEFWLSAVRRMHAKMVEHGYSPVDVEASSLPIFNHHVPSVRIKYSREKALPRSSAIALHNEEVSVMHEHDGIKVQTGVFGTNFGFCEIGNHTVGRRTSNPKFVSQVKKALGLKSARGKP